MAEVFDQSTKKAIGDLLDLGGTTGTWTDPDDDTVYTISSGLHAFGTRNETNDNVKYQAEPGGPVYIYTIHNNIRADNNDPDTPLNETQQHSALVTYVVNRDADGNTTVEVQDIQSSFTDAAGNAFAYPAGSTANLEMVSTDAGEVLTVQFASNILRNDDIDGDGDRDILRGRVNYNLDNSGNATSADAKVWDTQGDTVASDPDVVNVNSGSVDAVEPGNFSVVYASDGTPVIMQIGAPGGLTTNGAGNLTAINPDGTFGPTTDVPYTSGATAAEDKALSELFLGNTEQGIQSATVDGRTFVYSSTSDEFARAELTLGPDGTPQLSNPVYFGGTPGAVRHADNSIFSGSDVGFGGNDRLLAAPDIGDGNSYMLLGDSAHAQFFQVQPDGTLTPTGAASSKVSGETNPRNDLHVMKYEHDGQEYTGWLLQDPNSDDDSWEFFHPDTGWVEVVPQNTGEHPQGPDSDHDFFMINVHPTWIGTSNLSLGLDGGNPQSAWNYVADGGTRLVCFAEGTKIRTQAGERTIEKLQIGDLVATLDHGLQPIRWIGSRKVSRHELNSKPKLCPVRIKAGALGDGTPCTDLQVSPQHRVLARSKIAQRMFGAHEVLVGAKHLCEMDGIEIADDVGEVTYYHMLFDRHEVVFSNGAKTESMYTGPEALTSVSDAARDEIFALFPELRESGDLPPAARPLSNGRLGRQLAARHVKNSKPLTHVDE